MNKEEINRLNDKTKLKKLLMKDVKTDEKGRVLLNKDDEWRKDEYTNENFEDLEQYVYSIIK